MAAGRASMGRSDHVGTHHRPHVAVPSVIAVAFTWCSHGLAHVTRGICLTRACQFCCCGSERARCVFAFILLVPHRAQCNLHPAPPPPPPDPPRRLIRTPLFRSIPRQKSSIPLTAASYALLTFAVASPRSTTLLARQMRSRSSIPAISGSSVRVQIFMGLLTRYADSRHHPLPSLLPLERGHKSRTHQ